MSRRRRRLQLIRQAGGFPTAHDAELPVPVAEHRKGRGRGDMGCDCDSAGTRGEASPARGAPATSDRFALRTGHAGATEQEQGEADRHDGRA